MDCFADLTHVFWGCAAAATNNANSQAAHMLKMKLCKLFGCEVVMGLAVDNARKAGIRQHADGDQRMLAEVAEVFLHFRRASGAVDADDIRLHCCK